MKPLPTLPPGFFDLPPRRGNVSLSLDEADEFDFAVDQGPFQSQTLSPPPTMKKKRTVKGTKKKSSPNAAVNTPATTAATGTTAAAAAAIADWRSHYQKVQEGQYGGDSLGISLLVDTLVSDRVDEAIPAIRCGEESALLAPMSTSKPTPAVLGVKEKDIARTGSFGTLSPLPSSIIFPSNDSAREGSDTSSFFLGKRNSDSGAARKRLSSSSCNTDLTSGTSRTSCTSLLTRTSDASPEKSELPLSNVEPRPHYGSAFGSLEEKSAANALVRLTIDLRESIRLAKQDTRRRSNTLATPRLEKALSTVVRNVSEKNLCKEMMENATSGSQAAVNEKDTPGAVPPTSISPTKHKAGGVPLSKTQWSRLATVTSRSTLTQTANPAASRTLPGTVIKKTTIATKARLPIGTSLQPTKTPPQLPSSTPSSAFNLSLQTKLYRAPAYAMSIPKIRESTRTLHTSPNNRSLKAKRSEGHIRIPSVNDEKGVPLTEQVKSSVELLPLEEKHPSTTALIQEDKDVGMMASSADPKNVHLTRALDAADHRSVQDDLSATPHGAKTRTPGTSGVPLTAGPSVTAAGPVWITSSASHPHPSGADPTLRVKRLDSEVSGSDLSCSSSTDEMADARVYVAQKMIVRPSADGTADATRPFEK